MNSTQNATNLYNNLMAPMLAGDGIPCNYQINDVVLQQVAKSMNYQQYSNPPLKDESGLTFNNTPRKRPRDSSTANSPLISYPSVSSGYSLSFLGEDLSLEMSQQQLEVDRLISLHMEKIRREMEERRRAQSARVIQSIQASISQKLREKDDQIERIGKINCALEERTRSLYLENQIWRDLAQSNEATANALRSNLETLLLSQSTAQISASDASSCCGSTSSHGNEEEQEEESQVLKWRKVAGGERKRMCRGCGGKESSVLLLPCRHLCLCTACGSAVDSCPVCNAISEGTVHVNLS